MLDAYTAFLNPWIESTSSVVKVAGGFLFLFCPCLLVMLASAGVTRLALLGAVHEVHSGLREHDTVTGLVSHSPVRHTRLTISLQSIDRKASSTRVSRRCRYYLLMWSWVTSETADPRSSGRIGLSER